MNLPKFDITIIGSGIVGLSIAKSLSNNKYSVLVIEKNNSFGEETSSRNSEVVHSGIFNDIESLKYNFCKEGNDLLYHFCDENQIWYNKCGKLVISKENEEEKFEKFVQSLIQKNIKFDILNENETNKIEPSIISSKSIHIKNSGVVDSHGLMSHLFRISSNSNTHLFNSKMQKIVKYKNGYIVQIQRKNGEIEEFFSKIIINSAGLNSYEVASNIMGNSLNIPSMKFYKGSYFSLSSKWRNKFRKLIYSLPSSEDALGIHISFDSLGRVKLGPDYEPISSDSFDYSVSLKSREKFFESAKQYINDLHIEDLSPDYSGIRPKLFYKSKRSSEFYIKEESKNGYNNFINLIGIDSPGLTSSLKIGEYVKSIISRMNF
ncbi:MAG: hypothetical protein CMC45_01070 [Flavobacteriaceae bacterium]|nr:hypothetical protein [Flavobacteriaceae bacterium]